MKSPRGIFLLLLACVVITSLAYANSDTWATAASMPSPVAAHSVGVIKGKLYSVGGQGDSTLKSPTFAYDPATDTWTSRTSMPEE